MTDTLGGWRRTDTCGGLRAADAGRSVTLMGWVHRRRDHGGLLFVDLRDRTGLTQCVFDPALAPAAHDRGQGLRGEFVIAVHGEVQLRPAGTENPRLATGEVEVRVAELRVLNESRPLPFPIEDTVAVDELVRVSYRYLDLRRPALYRNFVLRDTVCRSVRRYLHGHGFLEVETPFLTRSTPEGARDFLVPSRLTRGSFYALPQSPQLFKQLLMVAGFERYFQIVRCFRDEDLRRDRQPEFTQIDIETSFLDRDDFLPLMEGRVAEILQRVHGVDLPRPFPWLAYAEALDRFGSDKPDMRFGLEIRDFTEALRYCQAKVFSAAIQKGGVVKGIRIPNGGELSRKELDDMTPFVTAFGAKGIAWTKITAEGWQSPVAKFLSETEQKEIERIAAAEVGDLLFAAVNLARHLKADPEGLLRGTNQKFERRFDAIEQALARRGKRPQDADLAEMDDLWNEAKAAERR